MIERMPQMGAAALSQLAQAESRKSIDEDKKSASSTVKTSFARHVGAKTAAIEKQKQESDANFEANKEKTSGGFWGALGGLVLGLGLALVGALVITAPLLAGVFIAAGTALMGLGSTLGGLIGESSSQDDQALANEAGNAAREAELAATQAEQQKVDAESKLQELNQRYRQALQDSRDLLKTGES